ncbi:MAG: FG-GAP-like repeat-containing protein, partial [Bacteroidota bacterium]
GENGFVKRPLKDVFLSLSSFNLFLIDFDGDNDLEIVTTPSDGNNIFIFKNTDNFESPVERQTIFLPGSGSSAVLEILQMADLNDDGLLDFLTLTSQINVDGFKLHYVLNEGNLNFGSPQFLSEVIGFWEFIFPPTNENQLGNNLQVYDYDFDGKKDILYTNGYGFDKGVYVLKNTTGLTSTEPSINAQETVHISPNPFNQELYLEFSPSLRELSQKQLILYDSWGRLIKSQRLAEGQPQVKLTQPLPSGMYYYQIRSAEGEVLASGTLVAE